MSTLRDRLTARLATVLSLALLAGLVTVVAEPVTGPAPAAAATATFAYTGSPQLYVVPDGVTSVTVTVKGAGGGGPTGGGAGGKGGKVDATIAVTAGSYLQVNVGGAGSVYSGGWNGGGRGFGGGASDIRYTSGGCAFTLSCALTDRLVVAGGGGGGGTASGSNGGDGGQTAANGGVGGTGATAGQAATSSAGGNKGTGSANGTDGAIGLGGDNGVATTAIRGGGGGGGLYGGGGGGADTTGSGAGGGGGGTSGAGGAGVSGASFANGDNAGAGEVTITSNVGTNVAQTFGYTGAPQVYSVPAGIELVSVRLYGGAGAGGAQGDVVYGQLPVSPGGFIQINVGGRGNAFVDDGAGGAAPSSYKGGWNGGGDGFRQATAGGMGGGGATDISMCSTAAIGGCNVTERRVIAAGGGGGDGATSGTTGGGLANGAAADVTATGGGGGGTLTGPGIGGSGTAEDGGPGYGGNGGTGAATFGGGGGGGLYGGGGGLSAPGGGGSSCASDTGACTVARNLLGVTGSPFAHGQGGSTGNGFVVITPVSTARTALDANGQALPPGDVVATSATIYGSVNPQGLTATASVIYSTVAADLDNPRALGANAHTAPLTPTGSTGPTMTGTSWLDVSGPISGLTALTQYYFRVCAESAAGIECGLTSSFTTMTAPATPTVGNPTVQTLSITNTSANFTGSVSNPGTGPTDVFFECATNSAFTTGLVTFAATPATVTGTQPISVTGSCTGLTSNQQYYVRIKAENTAGTAYSASTSTTFTTVGTPSVTTVVAVTAGSVSANYAAFTATVDNPGGGTSTATTNISFQCATDIAFTQNVVTGAAAPSVATGTSSVNVTGDCMGMADFTTYYVRLEVQNAAGIVYSPDDTSGPVSFTTLPITIAPTISSAPTVVSHTGTTAAFSGVVDNPGHGPTSIFFDCSTDSTFTTGVLSFAATPSLVSVNTPVNITGSCTGLTAGTQYYVRIRAVNTAAVNGSVSPDATFTTTAAPYPPTVDQPTVQTGAGSLTFTSAALTVDIPDPGFGPTSVTFQCATEPTFSTPQSVTATPATVSGTSANPATATATCTGLTANTLYYFRVKATNAAATAGVFSATNTFTTLAYQTAPVMGSVTVTYGSVTTSGGASSASFTANVTNPGSGNAGGSWSTTAVGIECSTTQAFTLGTVVNGTITSPGSATVTGRSPVAIAGTCTGMTPNTPYWVRTFATNSPDDGTTSPVTVYSSVPVSAQFTTPPQPVAPTATSLAVATGSVTANSAGFEVSINPGFASTAVLFECLDSTSAVVASAAGNPSPVTGGTAQTVAATCAPLQQATAYSVRVTATNSAGTVTTATVAFTTLTIVSLPAVSNATLVTVVPPAVNPTFTSVLLTGAVTGPGQGPTDAWIECSASPLFLGVTRTPAYTDAGMTTPVGGINATTNALTGLSSVPIWAQCSGFTHGTTYYARLVAENSAGRTYSTNQLVFTTPSYIQRPTLNTVAVASTAVDPTIYPPATTYTRSKASFVVTLNPGLGPTTVAFECSDDNGVTWTAGIATTTAGSPATGSAATVTGECADLEPGASFLVRAAGTNTPTDPSQNPGVQQTITSSNSAFTTPLVVAAPVFTGPSTPPPFAAPTVTSIAPGTGAQTGMTVVSGTVASGVVVVEVAVNGVVRTAGNPPLPTDACTLPTATTFECVLDPTVTAGSTLTITSTNGANPAQSVSATAIVPSTGTTPPATPQEVVAVVTQAEQALFRTWVDPGVGPTVITFVYSTNPAFATDPTVAYTAQQGPWECSTGTSTVSGANIQQVQRTCLGLPDSITTYWVRAKAENTPNNGTTSPVTVWSTAQLFVSMERNGAPSAPLGIDVTARTFTSLSLSAIIDTGNLTTTVTYQCSTDPAFNVANDPDLVTVVSPQSPVSGSGVRPTTATCSGLVAATQYYVRVLLLNSAVNSPVSAQTVASTLGGGGGGGGGGTGGGGGGGGPAPAQPGSLGPVTPNPFLLPGEFTVMENGIAVPGTYTATANGAQISRSDFSVTFRGLSRDREAMALSPAPKSAVIVACQGFIQVAGNGFANSSVGKLYLFEGGSLLYDIPMNSSGGFSVTVPLPTDVVGGNYDLQLNAYGKAGSPPAVRSVTVGVIVDVCPPPPPVTIIGKKQVTTIQQVYFDEWSADLDAKAQDTLRKLVKQTSREPLKVKSVGFVQGKGTPPKGWELSQKRADNVLDFLTGKGKMTPQKAVAKGRNVDGNVSPNRTVQVTVIWKKPVKKQVPADKVPPGAVVVPHGALPAGAKANTVTNLTTAKAAKAALEAAKTDRKAAKRALAQGSVTKAEKQALKQAKAAVKAAKKTLKQAVTKPPKQTVTKADSVTKKAPVTKVDAGSKKQTDKTAKAKASKAEKKAERLAKKAERVAKAHGADSKVAKKAAKKAIKAQTRADRLAHPKS